MEDTIDLFSLKVQDILNPHIWETTDQMKRKVRKNLLELGRDFFEYLEVTTELRDIVLTGSLAGYGYSKYSDLDIHVIFDFDDVEESDDKEFVNEYVQSKKVNWNEIHNIKIKGFEVELYPQDDNEKHHSTGIYSILDDKWVKKPIRREFKVDYNCVKKKSEQIMREIDSLYDKSEKKIDKLKDKIKRMRQSGLESGGEYSIENLVFKTLRRNGYIDKLYDMSIESYDKEHTMDENSLEEEDIYGYDHEPYTTIAGDAMGFEGWGDGSMSSGMDSSSDFGGGSDWDSSDSDFDLEESLKYNLRNIK